MSQAIFAAVGAMCSVLALGALLHPHSGAWTQLASAQATTVATQSTLSRSVPMPLAMPPVRAPARQYIPEPQQAQAQYQYAEPMMAQASPSATPTWAVPMAALTAAAGLLALAFRTLSSRSNPPLSEMAMCAAAGIKKTPIAEITNDDIAQYLKDGYKLLDARPKYERERIYPKDSAHVEFVREANTSPFDPIAFIRKQSAAQYAGFFRDLERNPDPIGDADKLFAKDDKLIIICGDGQRSASLARILQWEGGYTNLVIVKKGLQSCSEDQLKELNTVGSNVKVGYKDAALDRGGMLGVIAEGSKK